MMRIVQFLHKYFQTERHISLDKTLQVNRFASYQNHFNIKAAKEVMLENLNSKAGKGVWILKPAWRNVPLEQVYDQIVQEMEEWKSMVHESNQRRQEWRLRNIQELAKIAKQEDAKSMIIEKTGQIKIEW